MASMPCPPAWVGLCEVPQSLCTEHDLGPLDSICLSRKEGGNALTTAILQVVPRSAISTCNDCLRIHNLLHQVLRQASVDGGNDTTTVGIIIGDLRKDLDENQHTSHGWTICKLNATSPPPTCDMTVDATLIFADDEQHPRLMRDITISLQNRCIMANSTILLSTNRGYAILIIHRIGDEDTEAVYRVGTRINPVLHRYSIPSEPASSCVTDSIDTSCPGYEGLLQELETLAQFVWNDSNNFAAPSGILLKGPAGVGKTRLVSALACGAKATFHSVSAQDLFARASWATQTELLDMILPISKTAPQLVLIDDLHVLDVTTMDNDSSNQQEYMLVKNTVEAALDSNVSDQQRLIVGICRDSNSMPASMVRGGRLETTLHMSTPTQVQRFAILSTLLPNNNDWASALAPQTAGFVAADLVHLYTSAWTVSSSSGQEQQTMTWQHLRDAAQQTVPSQLSQLDVSTPAAPPSSIQNRKEVHAWSFRNMGGYPLVKKRLFRTVVMPWRRHLLNNDNDAFIVQPPRGVLFHGPSGTGKTVAADYLASSLGLHVVKVRASHDVLDQWLGGSEAAIRSLFARARGAAPCILFFDEMDAIAANRANDADDGTDVSSRILTTLLNEMDGISSRRDVLVLACTNRLDALDAALLRPGRLEEHVELPLPNVDDVREILKLHLTSIPLANDVDLDDLAELLEELNATGADVEGVCRDACTAAIRSVQDHDDAFVISNAQLDAALRAWKQ